MFEDRIIQDIIDAWQHDQDHLGRGRRQRSIPDFDSVRVLIETAFLASLKREEDRSITFSLALLQRDVSDALARHAPVGPDEKVKIQKRGKEKSKMANPEHLTKLKEGVEGWNKWRKDKPKIRRDLTGADLTEADLTEANLRKADLGYASLTEAVLERADLKEANLFGVNLRKANLFGADLRGANLRRADLAEANLEAANFTGAGNLEVEQLCEAKTLYKVQLDEELEKQVMGKCPHLLETPKHETGLGK